MDYKVYALMAILLASVASVAMLGSASAQATAVTVKTDKTDYNSGDSITISGTVTNIQAGQPLLLQVYNPKNALARTDPVTVAADGSWTYTFTSGGPLMKDSGDYKVKVTYRGVSEETTFAFTGTGPITGGNWKQWTVNIGGTDYKLNYQITGGTVTDMSADVDLSTLTVKIASTGNGNLMIQLPRNVMQALTVEGVATGGSDIDYEVFIDTIPDTVANDEKAADMRTLTINFEQGAEEIEIIGTWIVPEFGAIAAIVLAVAIVGIIVATAKYGKLNGFAPRL